MDKLTLEQFGAKVRLQYPQYRSLSNMQVAERVLAKYPQYSNNISDLKGAEKRGFGRKVLDFFTSNTQNTGRTLGQSLASGSVYKNLSDAEQRNSDIELQLVKKINENKRTGQDTSRLEKELVNLTGRQGVTEQAQRIIPKSFISNKQALGEVAGTGLEMLQGGLLKGAKGFGLARGLKPNPLAAKLAKAEYLSKPLGGKLAQIGKDTLKMAATTVPYGYAYDVSQNLQEDKSGMSILKPGGATLVSALLPVGIGAFRAGRQVTASGLKFSASKLSGIPEGAYDQALLNKMPKGATPETALNKARTSASAFKMAMQDAFGKGKDELITEMTGKRIGIDTTQAKKLLKIAERFGFEEMLPQNLQNMSVKETMDLLAEINNIPIIKEIDDPLVKNLKLSLSDIKDDIVSRAGLEEAFGGKFTKLYEDYSRKSKFLQDLQTVIGKVGVTPEGIRLNPTQRQAAMSRLSKIFQENAPEYMKVIKQLEEETGVRILDEVAAAQLNRIIPKTIDALNLKSGLALVTLPLSSPKFGSYLIKVIGGYGDGIVTKLLNANPKIRKAIYDAVTKEHMSFNDAVDLYAREYIKNPKIGLGIEDVSKKNPIYKGEKDLTTKILKDLEGKTTVSKQYILDATNRGELKQVERDLIRDILERETKVDTALTFKNLQADDYNTGIFGKDFDEPVKFYRGGTLKPNSKGEMWFTPEDWQALKYSEDFDAPSVDKVSEAFINSKKPFLLEGSEMGAYSKEIKDNWKKIGLKETDWDINDPKVKDKAIAYAKKNGYDSVFFRDSSIDGQTPMSSLVIFDEKLAKYNKIGSKVERTGKEQLSDTINVSDFAKKVKAELLPLEAHTSGSSIKPNRTSADYRLSPRYENISLPAELRGKIKDYRERIYNSPIQTSAAKTHFGSAANDITGKGYFGHTRIEDMADNKTRRVIEVQSDLYQKGNLEKEIQYSNRQKTVESIKNDISKAESRIEKLKKGGYDAMARDEERSLKNLKSSLEWAQGRLDEETVKLKLQQYNDPTAHFRMIREEIKKAAQDGKTKLQFPTGETAMKIEGLGGTHQKWGNYTQKMPLTPENLEKGLRVGDEVGRIPTANDFTPDVMDKWIITDVLGDGKFKAVPKNKLPSGFENYGQGSYSQKQMLDMTAQRYAEEFDISGKVDTNNPIYKFYEKDVQKYLNKFGGKRVVDDNGVSWIEVPIKKEWAKMPVEAFAIIGGIGLTANESRKK